jgi:hypothetical protein
MRDYCTFIMLDEAEGIANIIIRCPKILLQPASENLPEARNFIRSKRGHEDPSIQFIHGCCHIGREHFLKELEIVRLIRRDAAMPQSTGCR